jgi:hypothetical protein
MRRVGGEERLLSLLCDRGDVAKEDIVRREEREPRMVMVLVVPGEEILAPPPCVREIAEATRIVGLILCRAKARFRERIVIRDARSRVAAFNAELAQELREAVAGHGRASVLVHDKVAGIDTVAADRLGEQLLGQRAVFMGGDHPRDDVAAEQVQHNVQVQEHAALKGREFRVGSDRSALPAFRQVGFSGPPSEPDVRLSPHPALHVRCLWAGRVLVLLARPWCWDSGAPISVAGDRYLLWPEHLDVPVSYQLGRYRRTNFPLFRVACRLRSQPWTLHHVKWST